MIARNGGAGVPGRFGVCSPCCGGHYGHGHSTHRRTRLSLPADQPTLTQRTHEDDLGSQPCHSTYNRLRQHSFRCRLLLVHNQQPMPVTTFVSGAKFDTGQPSLPPILAQIQKIVHPLGLKTPKIASGRQLISLAPADVRTLSRTVRDVSAATEPSEQPGHLIPCVAEGLAPAQQSLEVLGVG